MIAALAHLRPRDLAQAALIAATLAVIIFAGQVL